MLKRSLCITRLVSAFVFVALVLSSCGFIVINHPSDTEEVTDAPSESVTETTPPDYNIIPEGNSYEKAKEYLNDLESRDLNERTITIVEHQTRQDKYSEIYSIYTNAIAERDKLVEEKYNVKIERIRKSTDTIIKDILAAKKSKEYYADLVLIPQSYVGFLQKSDALYNMADLADTDYTKPYFNSEAMLQATMGNATYAAIGEASQLTESYYCIFVNKDMLNELGLDIPYKDVYNGKWTFELFNSYIKEIKDAYNASESDADTTAKKKSKENERYALSFGLNNTKELVNTLFFSTGQNYFSCAPNELPVRAFDTELTQSFLDNITLLLSDEINAFDSRSSGLIAASLFANGEVPFYIGKVSDMFRFTNKGINWGIIPFPKANETQSDYGSVTSDTSSVFVVPAPLNSDEDIGLILQALNAAYYGAYDDALYENMTLYFICDSDTLSMLDRISNGALYDLSEMCSDIPAIRNASFDVITSTVEGAGSLEDNFKKSEYAMNLYMKRYFKIDEKEDGAETSAPN